MKELQCRDKVCADRKWRLEDIITNEEVFEEIFKCCNAKIKDIKRFKGIINKENAYICLKEQDEVSLMIEKLYVYAHMKGDENTANNAFIELAERTRMLAVDASAESSFINPEFARFRTKVLKEMLEDERYYDYDMFLKQIIRNKKHLLSEKEELMLSNIGQFSSGYKNIFQVFDNSDLKFDDVEVDGKRTKLSHGVYSVLLQNPNQQVRKEAFEAVYKQYKMYTNTLAANYSGNVNKNVFYARTRNFSSSLNQALFGEAIAPKVYDNLIASVAEYTPILHKYVFLRRKLLGNNENHMYDMYVPIVKNINKTYDYDDAYTKVEEALKGLGEDYINVLKCAKGEGWIDIEETQNKRSGAYSWGVYGVHPYVLLNHQGTTHDMFTIAHEMGHAMHSYYSNSSQPYAKSGYEIFVAEIASTVNEVLLIKHLLKTAKGDMRKYLLAYYLDMFRTTLFRQTMFAEFERFAHESVEKGEPLSSDKLSEYYYELNKKYYGEGVIHDDFIRYEWSRIPHFYNAFYVYKYATGLTCAVNIAKNILSKKTGFVEKYIDFLKSGGSDYPLNILKKVDIDLTIKKAYNVAMNEFAKTLEQLERMY